MREKNGRIVRHDQSGYQMIRNHRALLTGKPAAASREHGRSGVPASIWSVRRAAVEEFLLRPQPLRLLLCMSFAAAMLFCVGVFNIGFLTGASAYWQEPRGLVGNSWADISTGLSGYYYFVRDGWTLPLFQTTKLGAPNAVNIIFTDSIPIVAVFGRLLYQATGLVANPFGVWAALCIIASALSMTALVATVGERSIAAAIAATIAGLCMPALLQRWGHMSLMAQWEVVLALVLYFRSRSGRPTFGLAAASLLLAVLALWTHSYLFVMVVGIIAAAYAQAIIDRRLRLPEAVLTAAVFGTVLSGFVLLSGHLSNRGSLAAVGFGGFSMNLMSPFIPQLSGLFPAMRQLIVDGTGGQYEGFSYFGAGVLFLGFLALLRLPPTALRAWRGHAGLIIMLAAFAAFAVSNQIYVGIWHIAAIPLPDPVLTLASMFRSSGRFFWPCLYLLTAIAIAALPSLWGRAACWLLLLGSVLQLADTAPVRSALAARIAEPAPALLSDSDWAHAIRRHDFLRVVPPYGCGGQHADEIAIELQLLASRENVATNTVYATRYQTECAPPRANSFGPGELRVYLLSSGAAMTANAHCAASGALAVCSERLAAPDLTALTIAKP